MKAYRTIIVLAPAILGAAPPTAATGFAPGAWQHHTLMVSAEVPGVSEWMIKLVAGDRSRKSCYTAEQAATRPETLLTQDDKAVCKPRRFSLTGGKLVYETFCTNKRFPEGLLVASKGSFTPDSYEMSTTSTGTKNGQPVKIVTIGHGRRTAATCK